ncbi:MAG: hypothetical protein ACOCTI_04890 [Phycisphaeraceae bacterium]
MSFQSGRVSFCRFRVTGDAPTAVDETLLSILKEYAFRESDIGAPQEVETGWVSPDHLLDTQFTYEKCGFGNMLMFAMRMDTHKVPAELKQAYRKMNEQAAAAGNPSGFASKADKREAAELAGRQVQEDLASGRYRKSKSIPVLWDVPRGVVYSGASGNAVVEELTRLFRQSFACELELVSAGRLAGEMLRATGHTRDWEDLHPSPLTTPPADAAGDGEEYDSPRDAAIPSVPWCASAVDLKDFLGNEFIIWLWWLSETAEGLCKVQLGGREDEVFFALDKALDMDCAWGVRGKQTLRGDGPTRLREAGEALATGKWPRKVGLILSDGEYQFELTLQGDRMQVSAAALPEVGEAQSPRELIEGRLLLVRRLADVLDALYGAFVEDRTGGSWSGRRENLRQWIQDRRKPAAALTAE